MKLSKLIKLLCLAIQHRMPCLIVGSPGIGKTDIAYQVACLLVQHLIVSHPITADPTDYKGFPFPADDKQTAKFLPFGDLEKLIKATEPTICFIDDIGQAMPSVQAAIMQLVLARHIGEHKVADCVTFLLATNRRQDKAGVQGIIEPLKSRTTILTLEVDLDDWCQWALSHNMPAELIAYIRMNSDNLHDFKPTADMENSPCPRTWAMVGNFFNVCQDRDLLYEFSKGCVGEGQAVSFVAWLDIYKTLPSIDALLIDPTNTPLPTELNGLYAITVGLAARVTVDNFPKILTVANRLHASKTSEFAALLIKDSIKRQPDVTFTPEFQQMVISDLGKLIQ